MAVSKRLRYEILRRDSHTCRYCGATAPDAPLRVDHVTPVALGGTDEPSNLVTSCEPCNSGKTSTNPDAPLVADVAEKALHWADAMKQAAENLRQQQEPKDQYRDAFLAEWNRWHLGKDEDKKIPLPEDWKQAMDRFRVAGIPTWMWADIVDAGMANQKVNPDNTFRYCCGIAWNKVTELQAEARRIVGGHAEVDQDADTLVAAAVELWGSERTCAPTPDELHQFRTTVGDLREVEDAHRVMLAAQHAAWFGGSDAGAALQEADTDEALQHFTFSWLSITGEYPDEERSRRMRGQVAELLKRGVYHGRVNRAAAYAGIRRTAYLHFGLSEAEQKLIGTDGYFVRTLEVWSEAFYLSSGRWPGQEERRRLLDSMSRIGSDGGLWVADAHTAAAAAGAYQDPDITNCITRHLSVFEIAARPVGGEN